MMDKLDYYSLNTYRDDEQEKREEEVNDLFDYDSILNAGYIKSKTQSKADNLKQQNAKKLSDYSSEKNTVPNDDITITSNDFTVEELAFAMNHIHDKMTSASTENSTTKSFIEDPMEVGKELLYSSNKISKDVADILYYDKPSPDNNKTVNHYKELFKKIHKIDETPISDDINDARKAEIFKQADDAYNKAKRKKRADDYKEMLRSKELERKDIIERGEKSELTSYDEIEKYIKYTDKLEYGKSRFGNFIDAAQFSGGSLLARATDAAVDAALMLASDTDEEGKKTKIDALNSGITANLVKSVFGEDSIDKYGNFVWADKYKEAEEYGFDDTQMNEAGKNIAKQMKEGNVFGTIAEIGKGIFTAGPEVVLSSAAEMAVAGVAGAPGLVALGFTYGNEMMEDAIKEKMAQGNDPLLNTQERTLALVSGVTMAVLEKVSAKVLAAKQGALKLFGKSVLDSKLLPQAVKDKISLTVEGALKRAKDVNKGGDIPTSTSSFRNVDKDSKLISLGLGMAGTGIVKGIGEAIPETGQSAIEATTKQTIASEDFDNISDLLDEEKRDKIYTDKVTDKIIDETLQGAALGTVAGGTVGSVQGAANTYSKFYGDKDLTLENFKNHEHVRDKVTAAVVDQESKEVFLDTISRDILSTDKMIEQGSKLQDDLKTIKTEEELSKVLEEHSDTLNRHSKILKSQGIDITSEDFNNLSLSKRVGSLKRIFDGINGRAEESIHLKDAILQEVANKDVSRADISDTELNTIKSNLSDEGQQNLYDSVDKENTFLADILDKDDKVDTVTPEDIDSFKEIVSKRLSKDYAKEIEKIKSVKDMQELMEDTGLEVNFYSLEGEDGNTEYNNEVLLNYQKKSAEEFLNKHKDNFENLDEIAEKIRSAKSVKDLKKVFDKIEGGSAIVDYVTKGVKDSRTDMPEPKWYTKVVNFLPIETKAKKDNIKTLEDNIKKLTDTELKDAIHNMKGITKTIKEKDAYGKLSTSMINKIFDNELKLRQYSRDGSGILNDLAIEADVSSSKIDYKNVESVNAAKTSKKNGTKARSIENVAKDIIEKVNSNEAYVTFEDKLKAKNYIMEKTLRELGESKVDNLKKTYTGRVINKANAIFDTQMLQATNDPKTKAEDKAAINKYLRNRTINRLYRVQEGTKLDSSELKTLRANLDYIKENNIVERKTLVDTLDKKLERLEKNPKKKKDEKESKDKSKKTDNSVKTKEKTTDNVEDVDTTTNTNEGVYEAIVEDTVDSSSNKDTSTKTKTGTETKTDKDIVDNTKPAETESKPDSKKSKNKDKSKKGKKNKKDTNKETFEELEFDDSQVGFIENTFLNKKEYKNSKEIGIDEFLIKNREELLQDLKESLMEIIDSADTDNVNEESPISKKNADALKKFLETATKGKSNKEILKYFMDKILPIESTTINCG
jgi:hypothetical protein